MNSMSAERHSSNSPNKGLMNWNVQPKLPKRKSSKCVPNRKPLAQQT